MRDHLGNGITEPYLGDNYASSPDGGRCRRSLDGLVEAGRGALGVGWQALGGATSVRPPGVAPGSGVVLGSAWPHGHRPRRGHDDGAGRGLGEPCWPLALRICVGSPAVAGVQRTPRSRLAGVTFRARASRTMVRNSGARSHVSRRDKAVRCMFASAASSSWLRSALSRARRRLAAKRANGSASSGAGFGGKTPSSRPAAAQATATTALL